MKEFWMYATGFRVEPVRHYKWIDLALTLLWALVTIKFFTNGQWTLLAASVVFSLYRGSRFLK